MKNQNIYQNLNKLVITTKKIVLLFFAILNVRSSNADSFSQQFSADSLSQPLNPSIQEQPTISNAEAFKEMEEEKVKEGKSKKNEALEKIQTKPTAVKKSRIKIWNEFNYSVCYDINEELKKESQKKLHSFLRVYKNFITNQWNEFYFKIIDQNKFIIASFCSTDPDTHNSDTHNSDNPDFDSSEVDLRSFIKRATEHYYLTQSKNEENYCEENAVAAFGDKDSGEMIIKFLESICETAYFCCFEEDGKYFDHEMVIIRDISETIIDFIRESSETLNSQKQKISYPICYKVNLDYETFKNAVERCFYYEVEKRCVYHELYIES